VKLEGIADEIVEHLQESDPSRPSPGEDRLSTSMSNSTPFSMALRPVIANGLLNGRGAARSGSKLQTRLIPAGEIEQLVHQPGETIVSGVGKARNSWGFLPR